MSMRWLNQKSSLFGVLFVTGVVGTCFAARLTIDGGLHHQGGAVQNSGSAGFELPSTGILFEHTPGASETHFTARNQRFAVQVSSREALLALRSGPGARTARMLRMELKNAKAGAVGRGVDASGAAVRRYRGRSTKTANIKLDTYRKARFDQVYPGVDLVYYCTDGELEYDFLVAPLAKPEAIALKFTGQDSLSVDSDGALLINTPEGSLRQDPPVAYQEDGGKRQPVEVRFALRSDAEVGIELGKYQTDRSLIIDPKFVFSTYLGGSKEDRGLGMARDVAGNIYVTGTVISEDLPLAGSPFQSEIALGPDLFVARYTANGVLTYATYLGGGNVEDAGGIAVDGEGRAYVTGSTQSSDFPLAGNALQVERATPPDAIVARIEANGDLSYSTYLGGASDDRGLSVGTGGDGIIYVAGRTGSPNFPEAAPGKNGFRSIFNIDSYDGFLVKIDPTQVGAEQILYASYLGGKKWDEARNLVVRGDRVYVVGTTLSTDLPTTPGVFQPARAGVPDILDAWLGVFDLSLTGNASRVWVSYLGGRAADTGEGIAVNGAGNVYVVGTTSSGDFPRKTAASSGLNYTFGGGECDGYLSVFNPTGSALLRSTYIGGSSSDGALGVAVDSSNFICVTGYASSTNFPLRNQIYGARGVNDAFLVKLDQSNYTLVYSTRFGGAHQDVGTGVVLDEFGVNAYVTGITTSLDFPVVNAAQPVKGTPSTKHNLTNDAFVARIGAKRDPRVVALADRRTSLLIKECTGPLTSFVLDGSTSKGFNTRITLHRWSSNGLLVGIVPKITLSRPVGTYFFTLTATDSVGDSGSQTIEVRIVDTVAPSFTAAGSLRPANVTVKAPVGQSSATVTIGGPARGVDKCDGTITATGSRSDGLALTAKYPLGVTTITWVATDNSGNSASYVQSITVNP